MRPRRVPVYGAEVIAALWLVRAALDAPVGKRMAPFAVGIVERAVHGRRVDGQRWSA
jgi:hypothetical protein